MLNFRHLGGEGNPPMVILHGLLGSSRNWVKAGKALASRFDVFALDLPNHGDSPSMPGMTFDAVAKCILEWMDEHALVTPVLLGHSLGGKVVMRLAGRYPDRCKALAVADIAPREYEPHSRTVIEAMLGLDLASFQSRRDAEDALREVVPDLGLGRFMLTNLVRHGDTLAWQVNLEGLLHSLPKLICNPMTGLSAYQGPALFMRGENSQFIRTGDEAVIQDWFPKFELVTIPHAGHNIHFDNLPFFVNTVFHSFCGLSV
jgi:esterase